MIRRSRSQTAIERTAGAEPPIEGREPTARFAARNPRSGIHVLLNLERDHLWAAYRAKPSLLTQLLAPGIAAIAGGGDLTLRLIDPKGRIVHASHPGIEKVPITAPAPIKTAPQWAIEVLGQPGKSGRLVADLSTTGTL